jgi:hypothetical protein
LFLGALPASASCSVIRRFMMLVGSKGFFLEKLSYIVPEQIFY